MFEKFWRDNLKEIQENKIRFAAVLICFVFAVILFLSDDSGEEIILAENSAPVEISENVDAGTKIIAVKNSATSNLGENVKVVIGANSEDLFVHDPFKIPPKEKVKTVEIPTETAPPPVAQIPTSNEKFILRGTAIIGNNKSALVQKISGNDKNEENLILEIGDTLNGKKIFDISTDSLILEDGETLYIDIQN